MAGQTKKPTQSVLRAEAIYASFSREEERAFLFPGGANPMAELLYVEQGSLHSVADGRKLVLSHVNDQPMKTLRAAGLVEEIGAENILPSISDALGYAAELAAKK